MEKAFITETKNSHKTPENPNTTNTKNTSDVYMQHYDDLFKIVIIGDSGVGKSCLLLRLADDSFTENFYATIGVDFRFKCMDIEGKSIKLQIWDTAGQERFKTVTSAYYRGTDGIVIVYDQTNKDSFRHVKNWLEEIEKYTNNDPIKLILANKEDVAQSLKVVSDDEMKALEKETGIEIIKASAKSAFQVSYAFEKLTKRLMTERRNRNLSKGHSLEQPSKQSGSNESDACSFCI